MSDFPSPSDSAVLQCPACRSPLKVARPVDLVEEHCPVCRASVHLTMYPRLFGERLAAGEDSPVAEGEASCSFFPELRAEKVCDECGCFLSHRAAVDWGGRDLCLPCVHRLREVERSSEYLGRTKLNDRRALFLVTLLAPFSLFTAPIALVLLFRHRGKPEGFVPRSNVIWWLALILAIGCLIAWIVLFVVWISLVKNDLS
jgi:hypothetical protein